MHIYERMRAEDDKCGGALLDALLELQRHRVLTLHYNTAQLEQALIRDRQTAEPAKESKPKPPVRRQWKKQ